MEILNNYLVWAAAAVLLVGRQFVPAPLRPASLLGLPLVMGFFGVQAVVKAPPETALAVLVFSADAAAAAVLGLARGATMRIWRAADGTWMRRATPVTLGLWAVSVAVRIALGLAGRGQVPLDTITFFLAITFAAQNLATWLRMGGVRMLAAERVR
ncbi:MAG TPA: hypothetical protein VKF59_03340 [Candidatus Dormibacteraeota bacterium]|nr:hypothetical protein [Candidatus Dormibacteraeota bacterium]